MKTELLGEIAAARRSKTPVVLATRLLDGEQALLFPFDEASAPSGDWPMAAARTALQQDRSFTHDHDGREIFLRPYNPPLRLIVVGAVHVAQPLARLASEIGIAVTVVDPREAFAVDARFPRDVDVVRSWPDEAIRALAPDHRTAIVALTHDPKLDDPALRGALESDAFYIGALGSRKTHAKRLRRLAEEGVADGDRERVRGPIGLDIGARTPGEIAVAILAELVAHLRHAPG